MGLTKTQLFTDNQNNIAVIFKALGHPARVAIVEHLLKVNTCISGAIVTEIPLAQPTISQHLKELKKANIIQGSIEGNSICYCLNLETIGFIQSYFSMIKTKLEDQQNQCC